MQDRCEECEASALPECILSQFEKHAEALRLASRARKESMAMRNVVVDGDQKHAVNEVDTLGKRMPSDLYEGDVNLRTLRTLLGMVDSRGWERSAHQLAFHSAFERCVARVLFKNEWGSQRPAIMQAHGWQTCSSEVMIS